MKAAVVCIDVQIWGWTLDLYILVSYTIAVVYSLYSFILSIPFGLLGRFFFARFCRFLVVHRSPTKSSLEQIMVQGWLGKIRRNLGVGETSQQF